MDKLKRHKSRIFAVQTLYALEFNQNLPPKGDFDFFPGLSESEKKELESDISFYARYLIDGTIEHLEEVDALISSYSQNRPIDRIDKVERSILRLSFFELLYDKEVHPTIVIDESVKLCKELSNETSYRFINGILDKYVKDNSKDGNH